MASMTYWCKLEASMTYWCKLEARCTCRVQELRQMEQELRQMEPGYRRCRCAGGCDDEAMPGGDVCARCYTIEGCCELNFPDEPDSESHTESSPQLGDREDMYEYHSWYGGHG